MVNDFHSWNVSPKEARSIQESLRDALVSVPLPENIRFVAGADVSFNKYEKDVYAGIIVLSYPDLIPLEHALVKMEASFPYIPGYLSFREIPSLMACWEKLTQKPDVVVLDGHGIAHPRRLGIAAHFGLIARVPTVGAAKSLLYGHFDEPGALAGAQSDIIDQKTGERIGIALRTKNTVKPILVSPGHLADIATSVSFMKTLVRKHRMPEPTRLAHELVNAFRRGEISV